MIRIRPRYLSIGSQQHGEGQRGGHALVILIGEAGLNVPPTETLISTRRFWTGRNPVPTAVGRPVHSRVGAVSASFPTQPVGGQFACVGPVFTS